MGVCLAPCCFEIDVRQYSDIVMEVRLFLEGHTRALIRKIKNEMLTAAENQEFEKAAKLRDKLFSFEKVFERQVVVTTDFMDRDVISIARNSQYTLVLLLKIREGIMQGVVQYSLKDVISSDSEIVSAFLRHFYASAPFIPDEIIIPVMIEEIDFFVNWLSDAGRKKIKIIRPHHGDKAKLLQMAFQNAENRLMALTAEQEVRNNLLIHVQKNLKLIRYPRRIECFDNSGISGRQLVAGQVVYVDGSPDKSSYRRYAIRTVDTQDDYACMQEILTRRFSAERKDELFPDLVMVDGGKGQLNIAVSVLKKLGISHRVDIISIAKSIKKNGKIQDKIYKPERVNPINLNEKGDVLLFLQQIRDEAHRYSIAFHRQKRAKATMQSFLDGVPGIGRKRKMLLLNHFSSISDMKRASVDDLKKLPGMNRTIADSILEAISKMT
jgi:excinuclease ABC subunit C